MNGEQKKDWVATGMSAVFVLLVVLFWVDLWGDTVSRPPIAPADPVFTNTTTVRHSAQELIDLEADTSGMDCTACHEAGQPVELHYNGGNNIVLPPAHLDLVYSRMNCPACHRDSEQREINWDDEGNTIVPEAHRQQFLRHGENKRNNDCFNCHDKNNLAQLKLRDGTTLKFTESSRLCGGCHGPTYRDWEAGIHGRTGGHWLRDAGPPQRKDCTSCHDPHFPAFPRMFPAPAPHALRAPVNDPAPETKVSDE